MTPPGEGERLRLKIVGSSEYAIYWNKGLRALLRLPPEAPSEIMKIHILFSLIRATLLTAASLQCQSSVHRRTPSDEAIRALVRMCESHLSKGAFDMCKSSVGTQRCECRSREEGSGVYSITQVQADSADWPTAHNCCARRSATSTQWTRVVLMGSQLTAETHCFSCGGNSQF